MTEPFNPTRLETETNIWLATVRPDGRPHLVPIWFVWLHGELYILTAPHSVKARNLAANPQAVVSLEDGTHPLIAECAARFVPGPHVPELVDAFKRKYDWNITTDREYTSMIALTPRKWLAWNEGA